MAYLYAMSDIHGQIDAFLQSLEVVDLSDSSNKLLLLGDYIDHDFKRPETYNLLMSLQRKHPEQVVVLRGNIDELYISTPGVAQELRSSEMGSRVLSWIEHMPLFYQTKDQVFVHAGFDEDAGDLWKAGTDDYTITHKFPPSLGAFVTDVVAGHVGTASEYLANDPTYHQVFWDGESHYYIDGSSEFSHFIPVLKFDTDTKAYTTFVREPISAEGDGEGEVEAGTDAAGDCSGGIEWHWVEEPVLPYGVHSVEL